MDNNDYKKIFMQQSDKDKEKPSQPTPLHEKYDDANDNDIKRRIPDYSTEDYPPSMPPDTVEPEVGWQRK